MTDALSILSRHTITLGTVGNYIVTHTLDSLAHIWSILFHMQLEFKHLFMVETNAKKRVFSEAMLEICDCIFKEGSSLVKPIIHNEKNGLKTPVPWVRSSLSTSLA